MIYKPGQKVRCIDDENQKRWITFGKEYEIVKAFQEAGEWKISLVHNEGGTWHFYARRFVIVG